MSHNKSKKKRHSLHDRKLCRILFEHLSSLSECGLGGSFFEVFKGIFKKRLPESCQSESTK
nr:MAG TPA: hypothetical protein [Caudoviricetes sp.]